MPNAIRKMGILFFSLPITAASSPDASSAPQSPSRPPFSLSVQSVKCGRGYDAPTSSSSSSSSSSLVDGFRALAAGTAMSMTLLAFGSLSLPDASAVSNAASATPYSQSQAQKFELGLLEGKIRPCPSDINPNCVSTSSMNTRYAIPWTIPPKASENAARKILTAIQATQNHPKVLKVEDTSTGQFLQVEVDGLFGRDIMEFLVKDDVVTYRSLAGKVLYVYPFTTPITDFSAQERRLKALEDDLGWDFSPSWDSDY